MVMRGVVTMSICSPIGVGWLWPDGLRARRLFEKQKARALCTGLGIFRTMFASGARCPSAESHAGRRKIRIPRRKLTVVRLTKHARILAPRLRLSTGLRGGTDEIIHTPAEQIVTKCARGLLGKIAEFDTGQRLINLRGVEPLPNFIHRTNGACAANCLPG